MMMRMLLGNQITEKELLVYALKDDQSMNTCISFSIFKRFIKIYLIIRKLSGNSLHTFVECINACSDIYRVIQSSSTIFNVVVEEISWS
jgi:hypothetical protein